MSERPPARLRQKRLRTGRTTEFSRRSRRLKLGNDDLVFTVEQKL